MDEMAQRYLGIRERHCPDNTATIEADVVAVHGLAGDPYRTWIGTRRASQKGSPDINVDWLKDLLPEFVPRCRILSFGYQSQYMRNAPKRDIPNCAEELLHALQNNRSAFKANQRPIIFICHSLGGIVVKEALIKATLASRLFGSIRESTHGIIFLGTPHNGASSAKYGEILASIARALGRGSDTKLVHALREDSPELMRLARSFSDIYDDIDIFCFYELLPLKLSKVIVTQSSATIHGRPSDGLYANHTNINQFTEASDPNFVKFVDVLRNMLRSLRESQENAKRIPKAWELTSILVGDLDQTFDTSIQLLQTRTRCDLAAQSLLILRYRFQSWAFQLGLLTLSGTRLALNGALDTPATERINQQLQETIRLFRSEIVTEGNLGDHFVLRSSFLEEIGKNLRLLSDILPDGCGLPASYMTASLAFQPGTDLDSLSTATSHTNPDMNGLVAMKRISLLMEQAAARRNSSDPLMVKLRSQLVLDTSRSHSLSTGMFTGRSATTGAATTCQSLIEWKQYEGIWSSEAGNLLFERVELLTDFLRTATFSSSTAEDINLCLLDCLGYCHDESRRRLGLVFAVPRGVPDRRSVRRLGELMKAYQDVGRSPPLVGSRIELARMLCEALFGLHVSGWFHKSFNSRNILFFSETADGAIFSSSDGDKSDDELGADVEGYSILAPFIVGFGHSRPETPGAFSEPGAATGSMRRFTHPAYNEESPLQKYRHEFDYYSLGLVLIEIGYWTPLDVLLRGHPAVTDSSATGLVRPVDHQLASNLGGLVGGVYQSAVFDLLNLYGYDDATDPTSNNQPMRVTALVAFQTRILEALGACRV